MRRSSFPIESVCDRINPVVQRDHILCASSILRFRYLNDKMKQTTRGNLGVFTSFFSPFAVYSVSRENIMGTLAATLALTENSNVAQTLGAHLRRKRVAVTSSWMRDERVNQSLVAFSRCCMPCYVPIWETARERGFYLIGRKFPLLGNLLFMQDHLDETILPH